MSTINIIDWFKIFLLNHFKDNLFDTNNGNTIKQVFDIAKKLSQKERDFTRKEPMKPEELAFLTKYVDFKCNGYNYLYSIVEKNSDKLSDKKDKINDLIIDYMISLDDFNIDDFMKSLKNLTEIFNNC